MQEGSFRCDANVSIRKTRRRVRHAARDQEPQFSFRFLQQAIDVEVQWQIEPPRRRPCRSNRPPCSSTPMPSAAAVRRGSMRSKEDAHDYRYFPDPDLPPLVIERGMDRRGSRPPCPNCPARWRQRFAARRRVDGLRRVDDDAEPGVRAVLRGGEGGGCGQAKLVGELADGRRQQAAERRRTRTSKACRVSHHATLAALITRVSDGAVSHAGGRRLLDDNLVPSRRCGLSKRSGSRRRPWRRRCRRWVSSRSMR